MSGDETTAAGGAAPRPTGQPAAFVAWLVGERLLRALVSAVALALVARHLTPAGFGALNLALTVIGIAMPLAQFGLEMVVVRELVRAPERAGELLGTATVLRLAMGVGCALGVFLLGLTQPVLADARTALGPVSLMLIVQAFETPDLWFRAEVRSWPTAIARTVAVVASAGVRCLLVLQGAGLAAFAWVAVAELVAFETGICFFYRREHRPRPRWHWHAPTAKALIREAGGFAVAATLGGLAFRVDQLCVGAYLGDSAAGIYFAALRLIEIPTFVAVSIASALFPLLAGDDRAIEDGRFETAVGVVAALGWITAIGTTIVGPWINAFVFGPAYAEAAPALILRAWAMLPLFSGMVRVHLVAIARSPSTQLVTVAFGFALQLGLNLLLIPPLGLAGAALAFLGAELGMAWLLPLFLPTLRPALGPQWRAWLLPWQPAQWPRLLAMLRGADGRTPPAAR